MADSTTALISVDSLSCEIDERHLFRNLAFDLHCGETLLIEGENGAGKTTLLRIVAGLSSMFTGNIAWQGERMKTVRSDFLANCHYLGHLPGVKSALTPRENLHWYATLAPSNEIESIESALEKVGLYGFEDLACHHLSAGQQRRVALARLYLSRAPLWILDEPFTAIDKAGVAQLEALFSRHTEAGGALILTTHQALSMQTTIKRIQLGDWR